MDGESAIISHLEKLHEEVREAIQLSSENSVGLMDLRRELLGNGQPGRIQKIETEQRYLLLQADKFKTHVDRSSGAWGVVGMIGRYLAAMAVAWVSAKLAILTGGR